MKRFSLISVGLLLTVVFHVYAQDVAPYLYYFSKTDSTYHVERADGSDPHVFGAGAVIDPYELTGPGWSPDGKWFAFTEYTRYPHGYIVRPSPSDMPDVVEDLDLSNLVWSPDSRYVLATGYLGCENPPYCHTETAWLFDVEKNQWLASFDYNFTSLGAGDLPIEWDLENGRVSFYIYGAEIGRTSLSYMDRVTLSTDGTVIKQPITSELFWKLFVEPPRDQQEPTEFLSPRGSFQLSGMGDLTDTQTGAITQLPTPFFRRDGYCFDIRKIDSVRWDPTETWALINYELEPPGGIGTSIVRSDGSDYRQVAICGGAEACVGRLPDHVDVGTMKPLEPAKVGVTPTPRAIDLICQLNNFAD